jgi:SPP1 family phage portal protein
MIVRKEAPITTAALESVLTEFETEKMHIEYLKRQYIADQDILKQPLIGSDKPDHRLVNNFPGYITTVHTGYFIGQPAKYSSEDKDLLEDIKEVLEYNDEQEHNYELSKTASKCGVAKELYYIDEDGMFRIAQTEPEEIIVIYDETIARNIIGAVRRWVDADEYVHAVVYDKRNMYPFKSNSTDKAVTSMVMDGDIELHNFDDVPVSEFLNNREEIGDYEKVITLINEYDQSQSETANDFAAFTDAFLALYGCSGTTTEEVSKMKNDRVLVLPDGAEAKWLTKTIQDAASENHKNRLEADIHKFSFTPDLSDESFAGNTSGEAMKYKLWGLEQMAVQKERCFKKGLQRRFEIMCEWFKAKGSTYNYRDINIEFTRNMPKIIKDMAEVVQKLIGIVPKEILFNLLPFIDNVEDAIELLNKEKAIDLSKYENIEDNNEKDEPDEVNDAGAEEVGQIDETT